MENSKNGMVENVFDFICKEGEVFAVVEISHFFCLGFTLCKVILRNLELHFVYCKHGALGHQFIYAKS